MQEVHVETPENLVHPELLASASMELSQRGHGKAQIQNIWQPLVMPEKHFLYDIVSHSSEIQSILNHKGHLENVFQIQA